MPQTLGRSPGASRPRVITKAANGQETSVAASAGASSFWLGTLILGVRRLLARGRICLFSASSVLWALWACSLPPQALRLDIATPIPSSTLTPFQPVAATLTASPVPPTGTPTATFTPAPSATPLAIMIRSPVVQSVTLDSAIIVWDTDRPVTGYVEYGETADHGSRQSESQTTRRHAVQVTGLLPHTYYHYRVAAPDGPLTEDASFRTAAKPEDPYCFAVVGDTQAGHETHRLIVDRILSMAPDLVLHTGDLVADGTIEENWVTFFNIEHDLLQNLPVYPTLGNHEMQSSLYFDQFHLPGNERWYTFDYGNTRFIALEIDKASAYDPSSEQYGWLEAALAGNTQTWLVVYFHIPPYTGSREDAGDVPTVRENLSPLFVRHGVDLVFNGHHHNYQRFQIDGVSYVITGGGGGSMHAISSVESGLVAYSQQHNFVYVSVAGDALFVTVLSPDGETLDEFRLTSRR